MEEEEEEEGEEDSTAATENLALTATVAAKRRWEGELTRQEQLEALRSERAIYGNALLTAAMFALLLSRHGQRQWSDGPSDGPMLLARQSFPVGSRQLLPPLVPLNTN